MIESFGPWSTAIGTGGTHELDTFWKRRMAMLPLLNRTGRRPAGGTLLAVGALAIVVLALPTFRPAVDSAAGETGELQAADGGAPALAPAEYLPRPNRDEQIIIASLDNPVTIEFLDLPLDDCVTFLHEYNGIQVFIEKGAAKEAGINLYTPITLKMQGVRLESILNLLLEGLPLDYLVEDQVLKITSKKRAQAKMMTRTYPVRDLYQAKAAGESTGAASLMDAITTNVDPDSWELEGGKGSLTFVADTGSLVIRQSWSVHRKVLQLLRDLREAKRLPVGEAK